MPKKVIKNIFLFSHYNPDGACVRYRGKYLLEKINSDKLAKTYFFYPSYKLDYVMRFIGGLVKLLFTRGSTTVVIFQKIYKTGLYSTVLQQILKYKKCRKIYDIDDAYYVNHGGKIIQKFIAKSDYVITGSEALKHYALKRNQNVKLISSPVIIHPNKKESRNSTFTIGWVGSFNYHRHNLKELVFPAIKQMNIPVNFVIAGITRESQFQAVRIMFENYPNIKLHLPRDLNWQDEFSIYEMIRKFDVGLFPLRDNEIDRSKSAFKIKQYFSVGIPALASDIGENRKFLKHGKNGFFCNSAKEFAERLIYIRNTSDEEYWSLSRHASQTASLVDYQYYSREYYPVIFENKR